MQVHWPAGWSGEHLAGISSDPAVRDLGFREKGRRTDAKAPPGFIEVTCRYTLWSAESDEQHIEQLLDDVVKNYEKKGYSVMATPPKSARVGPYTALTASLEYQHDDADIMQTFTVAQNSKCLIDVMLTARRSNYDANVAAYEAVKAAVR